MPQAEADTDWAKAKGQGPLKLNKSKFILLTDADYIKATRNPHNSNFLKNNISLQSTK